MLTAAEGVPERDTKLLIAYARANNKVIIGPATVGGVQLLYVAMYRLSFSIKSSGSCAKKQVEAHSMCLKSICCKLCSNLCRLVLMAKSPGIPATIPHSLRTTTAKGCMTTVDAQKRAPNVPGRNIDISQYHTNAALSMMI
eukprot:1143307-Pelagomonas_calceolata.AAC.12